MIDDESRRKDEAFARKLRDWKRRRDGDCKLLFDVLGGVIAGIEQDMAARVVVRDFFDRRAHARPGDGTGRTRNSGENPR
jgi:hypothetical protein